MVNKSYKSSYFQKELSVQGNDIVQTERVNSLFNLIEPQQQLLEENKKSNSNTNCSKSNKVIPIGLFSNQFLEDLQILCKLRLLLKDEGI